MQIKRPIVTADIDGESIEIWSVSDLNERYYLGPYMACNQSYDGSPDADTTYSAVGYGETQIEALANYFEIIS